MNPPVPLTGSPVLQPELIPVDLQAAASGGKRADASGGERGQEGKAVDVPLLVGGQEYRMTCVSMGNPHAVIFTDHVAQLPLEQMGADFENHVCFPRRTNTEFVEVIDRNTVFMRVWERGTGETLACGSGSAAAFYYLRRQNKVSRNVTVHLEGGDIILQEGNNQEIIIKGNANLVSKGEYYGD